MTPKEKARELRTNFLNEIGAELNEFNIQLAERCALIAVDELIKENEGRNSDYSCGVGYWQQVKAEIVLL